jgi:hypothetical protein
LKKLLRAASALVAFSLIARIAEANIVAANPDPVFSAIRDWIRSGRSSDIFVKLEMIAYVQDAFAGLPDEVIQVASAFIMFVDLNDAEQ